MNETMIEAAVAKRDDGLFVIAATNHPPYSTLLCETKTLEEGLILLFRAVLLDKSEGRGVKARVTKVPEFWSSIFNIMIEIVEE